MKMINLNGLFSDDVDQIYISDLLNKLNANDTSREMSFKILSFLAEKSEYSGRLFRAYRKDGVKVTLDQCHPRELHLVCSVLSENVSNLDLSVSAKFKWCNAILKLLDRSSLDVDFLSHRKKIFATVIDVINSLLVDIDPSVINTESILEFESSSEFKVIPLTVLFWEGPIARAYLSMLYGHGIRPKKIINLVSSLDVATRKPITTFLPSRVRMTYCKFAQKIQSHYWSVKLQRTNPELFTAFKSAVVDGFSIPESVYLDCYHTSTLSKYSENVIDLLVSGLDDDVLLNALEVEENVVLFTGGGIVPRRLLESISTKLMHVHPGIVPDFRGADCTLWTHLILNQPSATLFYMSPGIDEGDVIWGDYLPTCNLTTQINSVDDQAFYRAIYSFFDPWVRSIVLIKGMFITDGFTKLKSFPQDCTSGVNFHFMHNELKKVVFNKFLSNRSPN